MDVIKILCIIITFQLFLLSLFLITYNKKGNITSNSILSAYQKHNVKDIRNFDAFDPDGKFIGSVRIEGDVTLPYFRRIEFRENCFWIYDQDEEDLFRIVKYRISN